MEATLQKQQVLVWEGTVVGQSEVKNFTDWFKEEFGVECTYLEEVKTLPDKDKSGNPISETGGRNDLFFSVKSEDSGKIAVKRLAFGMRWWEDVLKNGGGVLYTLDILEKYPKGW